MTLFRQKTYSAKLLIILLAATAGLLSAHIILQFFNWIVFYQQVGIVYELSNRFDLDDEASVGTWFSQFLFALLAVLAFLAGYLQRRNALKRLWWLIGLGALAISIDEVAGLHEFLLQSLHNIFYRDQVPSALNNAWLLVLPIILGVAGWLIFRMAKLLDKRTVLLFSAAIIVFLLGAVGVDQLTSLVERESFLHQGILVAIEETFELIATVIFVYTVASFIENQHGKSLRSAINQLKSGH